MALQVINVGSAPNDGQGDAIRTAYIKCNDNFAELYSRAQPNPPGSGIGAVGDTAGMYAYDSSYFYYCYADYDGTSTIWAEVAQIGNVAATTLAAGNSNVAFSSTNGNIVFAVHGTANVAVVRTDGFYTSGNITGGNIFGTSLLSVGGNITGSNILAQGTLSTTGNIKSDSGGLFQGLYNGSFVDGVALDYSTGNGRISVGSNDGINFFNNGVGNIQIASFDTVGALTLGTSGTANLNAGNVQATTTVSAASHIGSVVSVSANVTGGNLLTGGVVSSTGNITSAANVLGGNLLATTTVSGASHIGSIVSVSANVTGGNILTGGLISATSTITSAANITGGNLLTSGIASAASHIGSVVSVSANVTGGNLLTSGIASAASHIGSVVSVSGNITADGQISAVGNVIGQYLKGDGSQITGITVAGGTQIINGTSNVSALLNANITVGVAGTPNVVVWATSGEYVTGNVSASGNVIGGNLLATTTVSGASHIGSIVSASANITGGNLLTDGLVSSTGNITSAANIAGGNILATAVVSGASLLGSVVSASGNITGGNLSVSTGTITVGNIVNANSNRVGNIGSSSTYFNTIFGNVFQGTATTAQYADLAEKYAADAEYEPGTVMIIGGAAEVTASTKDADRAVVGVVSTQPAYTMNSGLDSEHVVTVALVGRVPCKVQGPIAKGDLLVSTIDGRAKADADPKVGSIVGKALENFNGSTGVIEIIVGKL